MTVIYKRLGLLLDVIKEVRGTPGHVSESDMRKFLKDNPGLGEVLKDAVGSDVGTNVRTIPLREGAVAEGIRSMMRGSDLTLTREFLSELAGADADDLTVAKALVESPLRDISESLRASSSLIPEINVDLIGYDVSTVGRLDTRIKSVLVSRLESRLKDINNEIGSAASGMRIGGRSLSGVNEAYEALEDLYISREFARGYSERNMIQKQIESLRGQIGARRSVARGYASEIREIEGVLESMVGTAMSGNEVAAMSSARSLIGESATDYGAMPLREALRAAMPRRGFGRSGKNLETIGEIGGFVSARDRTTGMEHIGRIVSSHQSTAESGLTEYVFEHLGLRSAIDLAIDTPTRPVEGLDLPSYFVDYYRDQQRRGSLAGGVSEVGVSASLKHTERVLGEVYTKTLEGMRRTAENLGISDHLAPEAAEYATDLMLGTLFGGKDAPKLSNIKRWEGGELVTKELDELRKYRGEIGSIFASDDDFSIAVRELLSGVTDSRGSVTPMKNWLSNVLPFVNPDGSRSVRTMVRDEIRARVVGERASEAAMGIVPSSKALDEVLQYGGPLTDMDVSATSLLYDDQRVSSMRKVRETREAIQERATWLRGREGRALRSRGDLDSYRKNLEEVLLGMGGERIETLASMDLRSLSDEDILSTFGSRRDTSRRVSDKMILDALAPIRRDDDWVRGITDQLNLSPAERNLMIRRGSAVRADLLAPEEISREVLRGTLDPRMSTITESDSVAREMSETMIQSRRDLMSKLTSRLEQYESAMAYGPTGLLRGVDQRVTLDRLTQMAESSTRVTMDDGSMLRLVKAMPGEDWGSTGLINLDFALTGSESDRIKALMSMGMTRDEAGQMAKESAGTFRTAMRWEPDSVAQQVMSEAERSAHVESTVRRMMRSLTGSEEGIDDYFQISSPTVGMFDEADMSRLSKAEVNLIKDTYYNPATGNLYYKSDGAFSLAEEDTVELLKDMRRSLHGDVPETVEEAARRKIETLVDDLAGKADEVMSGMGGGGRYVPVGDSIDRFSGERVTITSGTHAIKPAGGIGSINDVTNVRLKFHEELIRSIYQSEAGGRQLFELDPSGNLRLTKEFMPIGSVGRTRSRVTPESAGYDLLEEVLGDIQSRLADAGVDLSAANAMAGRHIEGRSDPLIREIFAEAEAQGGIVPSRSRVYTPFAAGNRLELRRTPANIPIPGTETMLHDELIKRGHDPSTLYTTETRTLSEALSDVIRARGRVQGLGPGEGSTRLHHEYQTQLTELTDAMASHYDSWMEIGRRRGLPEWGSDVLDTMDGAAGSRGVAAAGILEDSVSSMQSSPVRATGSSVLDFVKSNKTIGAGLVAIGGLALYGAYSSRKRRKDYTPDDMAGPPNLPGGSAYEGYRDGIPPSSTNQPPNITPSSKTYKMYVRGHMGGTSVRDDVQGIVGGTIHSVINQHTDPFGHAQRQEQIMMGSY